MSEESALIADVVFTIDGRNFDDFAGFVREFNRVFCSPFNVVWEGNLDAFNDYLSWPEEKYTLVWKHSGLSRQRLGYSEMVRWLAERVQHCHPANVTQMQAELEAAKRNEGPTVFDWLVEIIGENHEFCELQLA